MKLYATTTSERATKGQGGDYLEIVITHGDSKNPQKIAIIRVDKIDDNQTELMLYRVKDNKAEFVYNIREKPKDIVKQKAEKQKKATEVCRKCEEVHHDGIYHICPDNQ